MSNASKKPNNEKCPFCKKPIHSKDLGLAGNHIGDGGTLGQRIMSASYSKYGKTAQDHPLSIPHSTIYFSIAQAHHLVCSEVLNTEDWGKVCAAFGYDVNCKENGAFFPADMRVACQYKIPLHRGNHSQTQTNETPDYVSAVKSKVQPILDAAINKKYCDGKKDIIAQMNSKSKAIWGSVKSGAWILTIDGKDYKKGGKGCAGYTSLSQKKLFAAIDKGWKCPGKHNLTIKGPYFIEQ